MSQENNPFLSRQAKDGTKHGVKAEHKLAKRIGGEVHSGSGARTKKGDISVGCFKVEAKSTVNDSISLKLEYLLKVAQEALETNEYPALAIQFVLGEGQCRPNGSWVCIRERDFKEILELANEQQEAVK